MPQSLRIPLSVGMVLLIAAWIGLHQDTDGPESSDSASSSHPRSLVTLGINEGTTDIEVEARGRRFQWTFRYPGPDSALGTADDVTVGDELHLPRGLNVTLHLESDDYVYSLSCPSLDLKEIAVPDLTHTLHFRTPIGDSRHPIQADPMCGWQAFHDDVMGMIIIEPNSALESWIQTQTPTAVAP